MRELRKKCRWCGKPFTSRSNRAKDCPDCRDDYKRALACVHYREKCGLLAEGVGRRAAVEAEVRKAVEERRRRAAANRPRCLYCGNVYGVNSSGYCATCRSTGLDGLHKETGRTNGWDRPTKGKVEVVGGWRGRPVAGHSIRETRTVIFEDWS